MRWEASLHQLEVHTELALFCAQESGLITESSDKGHVINITINGCEQIYAVDEVSQMPELLYADLYAVGCSAMSAATHAESLADDLVPNSLVSCLLELACSPHCSTTCTLCADVLCLPQFYVPLNSPLNPCQSVNLCWAKSTAATVTQAQGLFAVGACSDTQTSLGLVFWKRLRTSTVQPTGSWSGGCLR